MSVERIQQHFRDSAAVKLAAVETLALPIAVAVDTLFGALANGNRILACGNGGSAAAAQRFAAGLIGRFERERPGLPAIALTTDTSVLTALANDSAYDEIFARQIRALGQPGDVLLAITTSGYSTNVLAAIDAAHEREMIVVALTGNCAGQGVGNDAESGAGNVEGDRAGTEAGSEAGSDASGGAGNGGGAVNNVLTDLDIHICVPSERTARVHEVHLLTIHCLCDGIDAMLLGEE
jgi:D-sedoheptulose 7-phosphate isomerase